MIPRLLKSPESKSFFLFGPRGVGKTSWVRKNFPSALYFDLLKFQTRNLFQRDPSDLETAIPQDWDDWVIIDEVQKVPALLNEVHRLIESRRLRFILTGSSARALRKKGVNLLAGRAVIRHMHPLSAAEMGDQFDLHRALVYGHLPAILTEEDPADYLTSYVEAYLREEVQQEGLVRDLGMFSRFLEAASFAQGGQLNVTEVARECGVNRRTVSGYFGLSEDLMLSSRLYPFSGRSKRRSIGHPKFYFFDVGIWRAMRSQLPSDVIAQIDGVALETLVFQELRAINDALRLDYQLYFWRNRTGHEVDFILYGPNGFHAIEVKRQKNPGSKDLRGLKAFKREYPEAKLTMLYGADHESWREGIHLIPAGQALLTLPQWL